MPLPGSCREGCARRLPGVGRGRRAGLSSGQQRDLLSHLQNDGASTQEREKKIRILKETAVFLPRLVGKKGDLQRFPAITGRGVWDCRQNIGFFFIIFYLFISLFISSRKQIQYFLILLRGGCRAREAATRGEGRCVPPPRPKSSVGAFCPASSVPNPGDKPGVCPKQREMWDWGGETRGRAQALVFLGASQSGHGTSPPRRPRGIARVRSDQKSPMENVVGTRGSSREAFMGLEVGW